MARVRPGVMFAPFRGSHLPVLMKAVSITRGPVLELGCGLYSTNPLHWACFVPKRKLVTYENNPNYYDFLKAYEKDFHEVHCIKEWDAIDISDPWSVAFVDNDPGPDEPEDRRWRECVRLQHAEYVVLHDSEPQNEKVHRMSEISKVFKYEFRFRGAVPNTTIYSNVHDVTDFLGEGK
jgi:hypothetical protein